MAKDAERAAPFPAARKEGRLDPVRAVCTGVIAVAVCLSFARLMEADPLGSANDKSRWCTVWSLVERGTYQIDEATARPGWDTIDKVLSDGHFYSTKPPLFSTLVAGAYWLEKKTWGWTLDEQLTATVRLLLVFVNIIPWAVALWVLSELVRRVSKSTFTTLLITLTAGFGTLLTPFLTTLNNHVPAAICVIFALDAATRITIAGDQRWWWYALCGFFAAFAACNELTAAAFGAAMFGLLVWRWRQPSLSYFLPAALLPLVAFFVTNAIATGGIKPFYASYGTEMYEYVHEGVPSYWLQPKGIDVPRDSVLTYALHCTVGHHGVFSLSPIFLLVLLGWFVGIRKGGGLRDYLLMGLALTLVVLGFFLLRTENYNYGGKSVALRWMLWLVPFWLLALVPALDAFENRRWFRYLAVVLLIPSIFSAWYPSKGPWTQPWLFTVLQNKGWINYEDPPLAFDRHVNSWLYRLPDGETDPNYWVELASVDADGLTSIVRISDGGPELVNQRLSRRVILLKRGGAEQPSQMRFTIDVEAFRAGAPIEQFLVWPQGRPGESGLRVAQQILSGLPFPAPFQPVGGIVYRKGPARQDAFECLEARAGIDLPSSDPNWEPRTFVCRAVLSEEVPFGILKIEKLVYPSGGSEPHALRRLAFHAAGKYLPRDGAPQDEKPLVNPPSS